jgi:hypothetical protein
MFGKLLRIQFLGEQGKETVFFAYEQLNIARYSFQASSFNLASF